MCEELQISGRFYSWKERRALSTLALCLSEIEHSLLIDQITKINISYVNIDVQIIYFYLPLIYFTQLVHKDDKVK